MRRFDGRCPHCNERIAVYDHFVAHDYSLDFRMDCPLCDETIQVDVHTVPEFELSQTTDRDASNAQDSNVTDIKGKDDVWFYLDGRR